MALSFEKDIRPLFTEEDLMCMSSFGIDLGSATDLADQVDVILERIEDRTMPPDRPWSDERIALFRRWVDEGMPA